MENKEQFRVVGKYNFFDLSEQVKGDDKLIGALRDFVRGKKNLNIDSLKEVGIIKSHKVATNIIPTTGFNVIARLLAGDATYSGEVDYGALGSGTTPFTLASTQLSTEVFRKQAASQAFDDNVAYIDWFIEAGDVANQTFEEFGAFIDGTGSANSGQAWSLLLTNGWVKSGSIFISAAYSGSQQ